MLDLKNLFYKVSDFELIEKKLGKGTFSHVYIAKNKMTNEKYAIKILKTETEFDGDQQMRIMQESLIHLKLDHPAILKFRGLNFQSFKHPMKLEPSILTDYMPNGTLREIINSEKMNIAKPNWNPTKKYINFLGISHAMKYLHKNQIIHRDLKPENILSDDNLYPQICDFGLSRYCSIETLLMTKKIGTRLYMAPELYYDDEYYGKGVDVYAFSLIVYEMMARKMPFLDLDKDILNNESKFFKEIKNGYRPSFPESIPAKMKELIMQCWDTNPNKRPSFEYIFNELSRDFYSYIDEYVDADEIKYYLDILEESDENEKKKEEKKANNDYADKRTNDKDDKKTNDKDDKKTNDKDDKKTNDKDDKKINDKDDKRTNDNEDKKTNSDKTKNNKSTDEMFFKGLTQLILEDKKEDKIEAISYIKDASEKGNSYSSAFLGILYEKGIVLKQDFKEAEKFYTESSLPTCTWGLERLGNCYLNGYGVEIDNNKAEQYFEMAHKIRFDPVLLQSLGECYESGKKYELNYHKAFEYYKRSFLNGNIEALISIGHLYEKGYGVKQNLSMARLYYERASKLGSQKAKNLLDEKRKENFIL